MAMDYGWDEGDWFDESGWRDEPLVDSGWWGWWSGSGSGSDPRWWSGSGSGWWSGSGWGWWRWYDWRMNQLRDKVDDLEDELEVAEGILGGLSAFFLLLIVAQFVIIFVTCYKLRGIRRALTQQHAVNAKAPLANVTVVNGPTDSQTYGRTNVYLEPLPDKSGLGDDPQSPAPPVYSVIPNIGTNMH